MELDERLNFKNNLLACNLEGKRLSIALFGGTQTFKFKPTKTLRKLEQSVMCKNWERCSEALYELRTMLERIASAVARIVQTEGRNRVGCRKAGMHLERLMKRAERTNSWNKSLLITCYSLAENAYRKRCTANGQMTGCEEQDESEDSADDCKSWERRMGTSTELVARARKMREYLLGPGTVPKPAVSDEC